MIVAVTTTLTTKRGPVWWPFEPSPSYGCQTVEDVHDILVRDGLIAGTRLRTDGDGDTRRVIARVPTSLGKNMVGTITALHVALIDADGGNYDGHSTARSNA